jgi:TPP-dependent trihydroxycyclohexane-1,2-dione (THcHDO) dehydratase
MRPAPNWQKLIMPVLRLSSVSRHNRAEGPGMTTIRLTMAQALIRYLAVQTSEVDGREFPLFSGVFAIFGHGNVAGIGEALCDVCGRLPTLRAHNEQAMGLAAIGFCQGEADSAA